MTRSATKTAAWTLGLLALAALGAGPAQARVQAQVQGQVQGHTAPYAAPPAGVLAAPLPLSPVETTSPPVQDCCRLSAGTVVAVQVVGEIGTQDARSGDTFPLKLAAPVVVDGQVVLAAGTPGVGRVVQSSKPGMGGKGAKLVVAAEYLTVPGGAVPLEALQLGAVGKDQSLAANASSVGGLVFMPLGFLGFAVKGGDMDIPAGTAATAKIGKSVTLPPMAVATAQDIQASRVIAAQAQTPPGAFVVPDPPAGMGQVVFFRRHTVLGTAQWFNVRDDGAALGKLNNGSFFIVPVSPGQHSFTAKTEPEFNDMLTLQIDPGETYYVEAMLTKGVLIGVPDLTPSDRTHFDAAVSQMQAMPNTRQETASR
jgi:hypothetical protein